MRWWLIGCLLALTATAASGRPIELKAWGVPDDKLLGGPEGEVVIKIAREFERQNPDIRLVPATGLTIPGRSQDVVPLMQIAGEIAPAVMYVSFRHSSTYISQKFLYPLDEYLEREAGRRIPDGHLLDTEKYLVALRAAPRYAELFADRIPMQCWEVIRRECPYGATCPYVREWQGTAAAEHFHTWCLPQSQMVKALFYRRDVFAEAGLPDRVPDTMEELLAWARQIHNPKKGVYGIEIPLGELSYSTLSFFYSCGARAVERDEAGNWRCVFNTPAAVEAYYFVARMFLEPFENQHGRFEGVVYLSGKDSSIRYGMNFNPIDQRTFNRKMDPNVVNFGPVPKGPTGVRGSEFNARMTGIYAGFEKNIPVRDAAWKWMLFYGGNEANLIQAKTYVENGLGQYVQPKLLAKVGYPELIQQVPRGWVEAAEAALKDGVPEPYGKNCQMVYQYMSQAIDQIRTDGEVRRHIRAGNEAEAKRRIQEILDLRVRIANEKMLNIVPDDVRRLRVRVAMAASFVMFVVFTLVVLKVFKTFSQSMVRSEADKARGEWQFGRFKVAYLILIPAILTIATWDYWPILRGSIMAFQDYNVRGFSTWVGFDNFATVLFSREFWYAMLVSFKFTALYMIFGFFAPIILALLLTEVPRGRILFRTIFYLPAMLSGVVVLFLWKGFYGRHGMINQVLNYGVAALNYVLGTNIAEFTTEWLDSPQFALFFCLIPMIWAHMGPGCLIYLAALKGIPEELYEAADIDGASAFQKAWYIALPSIKALIAIQFIGAAVGHMKAGGTAMMAMTGGGPYTPYGETEVVGLHIFWEAFGYLRFGVATAMAWVLSVMLVGFTLFQLRRLSRMEFKAAGGK